MEIASLLSGKFSQKIHHKELRGYESNMSDKMKIVLKDGGQVDSKSGLEDSYHVYKQSEKLYSVVLGLVDISKGMNSYYKLQVLEADDKSDWYLFRSWGRIGTNIGDFRLENKDDLQDALADFNKLYEEKTGNRFKSKNQEKLPGYWYPLDIDHGEKNKELQKLSVKKSKSKLALAIQELISLIFDVKKMECTMMEYELDLRKMPLGKLSQKQIEDAFKVLSEVMEWIDKLNKKEESEETKASSSYKTEIVTIKNHILDCSNRFYTLIPHDFGVKNPPLLDNEEYIKNKIDMVNSLKEIEIAYNLLKSESKDSKAMDPIDEAYKKLKTEYRGFGKIF
ncbi:Poly [ADP-ribose] polymerase 1 [Armadillidium vulgare]|nr:Poly [ADP-ribose] polymerase 1 [Armadillidium vulgare]